MTSPLRDAAESATAGVPVVYWAVHSRTGVHIGLWPDADDASKVFLEEYSDGTLTKLVPASALDTARAEIERLRVGLNKIIAEDDTGPMRYEPTTVGQYTVSQAIGGSEGRFAAIALATLSPAVKEPK